MKRLKTAATLILAIVSFSGGAAETDNDELESLSPNHSAARAVRCDSHSERGSGTGNKSLREEIVQFKTLLAQLSQRLDAMQRRVERLERATARLGARQEDAGDAADPTNRANYLRFSPKIERGMLTDPDAQRLRYQGRRIDDPLRIRPGQRPR